MSDVVAKYRSSVLLVSGLALAASVSLWIEGGELVNTRMDTPVTIDNDLLPVAPLRGLTQPERAAARTAWRYFEENTRPETGFVDSVAGYPAATLWDQGSYVFALISARRLDIIDDDDFDERLTSFLTSLSLLPLFEGRLPNKVYNTMTLAMVNYGNEVVDGGIGWSAIDIARLLLALRSAERHFPRFGPAIRVVIGNWKVADIGGSGELIGANVSDDETNYVQEGRIGYEQYAARAAALWGLDVGAAISVRRVLAWTSTEGVDIPKDRRSHLRFGAITPVLSEPFVLQGLELGFDADGHRLAQQVYRAQEARYENKGIITAVTEDHLDRDPYFLYAAVRGDGKDWPALTEGGGNYPELRTVSVKAAFGWDAIFGTEYTEMVVSGLADLGQDPGGWMAGRYEATGEDNAVLSLNTNAVVLEALHRVQYGPFMQAHASLAN